MATSPSAKAAAHRRAAKKTAGAKKKATAGSPDRPKMKRTYYGVQQWVLAESGPRKVPTEPLAKVRFEESKKVRRWDKVQAFVAEVAAKYDVDPNTLTIHGEHWNGYTIVRGSAPETEAAFRKRIKEVENHNKALAAYREDLAAIRRWENDLDRAQREADREAMVLRRKAAAKAEAEQRIETFRELLKDKSFRSELRSLLKETDRD